MHAGMKWIFIHLMRGFFLYIHDFNLTYFRDTFLFLFFKHFNEENLLPSPLVNFFLKIFYFSLQRFYLILLNAPHNLQCVIKNTLCNSSTLLFFIYFFSVRENNFHDCFAWRTVRDSKSKETFFPKFHSLYKSEAYTQSSLGARL